MNFSEPFSPRGPATASGSAPLPGPFTGQTRDLPAPLEFASTPGVQWLAQLGGDRPPTGKIGDPAGETTAPSGPAPVPMVPVETGFRLQELATALARPRSESSPISTAPAAAEVSLSALADQLQSRFTQPEPTADGRLDLLGGVSPALPASPASDAPLSSRPWLDMAALGVPEEGPEEDLLTGSPALEMPFPAHGSALDSSPSPASSGPLPGVVPPSARPTAMEPAFSAKRATARQGDVYFGEFPAAPAGNDPDPKAGPQATRETFPARDAAAPLDLMAAPEPVKAARILNPEPAAPLLPPPLPSPPAPPFPADPVPSAESGLGLILGGTGLILLGIHHACQLPMHWLDQETGSTWDRQKVLAAMVLHGAAALTALTLGTGSVMLRRWAPPLIHAAGWIAALTASGIIAVTGFHLIHADDDTALPGTANFIRLLAALLVPLACIFYYQQESAATACESAQPTPSWTDRLPVPALMVFLTGLALATGAGAMLCHQPAFPAAMEPPLTGPAATAAWATLGILGLAIAGSVCCKNAAALWLLLLVAVVLAATVSPAALTGGDAWLQFLTALGAPAPPAAAPSALPLLSGLLPAPLLLVFAMARRSFSSPPPP